MARIACPGATIDLVTTPDLHGAYVYALGRIGRLGRGGHSELVGPLLCIDAGIGVSKFNIAVATGPVPDPRQAVRDAMGWFAARGLNLRFDLRANDDSALLAAAMLEGFAFWWREPVMVLDPLPGSFTSVPGLAIREVRSAEDRDLYCQADIEEYGDQEFQLAMVSAASEMEGVSMHLGLRDGIPVARSMGVVHGQLVGIHNVYVPPSCRGQGFGAALTAAAVDAGRAAGARAACLEATDLGLPVYRKMGFRRVDDYVVVGRDGPPA